MKRRLSREFADQPRALLLGAETESETGPIDTLGEPLDLRGVAELIGCSTWTVRQTLIPRGLPCFRSGPGGRLIFFRSQVVRWILRHQRKEGMMP